MRAQAMELARGHRVDEPQRHRDTRGLVVTRTDCRFENAPSACPQLAPCARLIMTQPTPALRRALGRWDLTAVGVNQVIGGSIFLLPSQIAAVVGAWSPISVGLM